MNDFPQTWWEWSWPGLPRPLTVIAETEKMIVVEHEWNGEKSTSRQMKRGVYRTRLECLENRFREVQSERASILRQLIARRSEVRRLAAMLDRERQSEDQRRAKA